MNDEYMSRADFCEVVCGAEKREGYKTCKSCHMLDVPAADVKPVKKTEFQIGYEQGFNHGRASAALPNTIDNGDKIDGYTYMYKTDSRGEPYIHIDSVRSMLKKATDVQPVDRWVSVKERLPDEGQKCLVYRDINDDLKITTGIWHSERKAFDGLRHGTRLEDAIAWIPLPAPPKDGDTE